MNSHIQQYISSGYSPIQGNTSRIAGTVLIKGNKVVKFGQDSAYDEFIQFIQGLQKQWSCFPVISNHDLPKGAFSPTSNIPYTITEMEVLQPLNQNEKQQYESWIKSNISVIGNGGKTANDPFGLEQGIQLLIQNAQTRNINLDLMKGDNIMQRSSGEYVITDPYN